MSKAVETALAQRRIELQKAYARLYARTGQIPTTYAIWREAGL